MLKHAKHSVFCVVFLLFFAFCLRLFCVCLAFALRLFAFVLRFVCVSGEGGEEGTPPPPPPPPPPPKTQNKTPKICNPRLLQNPRHTTGTEKNTKGLGFRV